MTGARDAPWSTVCKFAQQPVRGGRSTRLTLKMKHLHLLAQERYCIKASVLPELDCQPESVHVKCINLAQAQRVQMTGVRAHMW